MRPEDVRLDDATMAALHARARSLSTAGDLSPRHRPAPAELAALQRLVERLANTYPYHDAHYVGQVLKPPHPVAWAAYATAMLLNPNNHALDGGPATAEMEREAVAALSGMLGFEHALGHLAASGTIANLEALWIARQVRPGEAVLSAASAHYTHARMCSVLGLAHETLPVDQRGALDLEALEARLRRGGVGTVVATLGTTGLGALDPVSEIVGLCRTHGCRVHVDAAYGGFFALLADGRRPGVDPEPFRALATVDSIVVDPHKHGLQPYGCGCVLFADAAIARHYAHDSPYAYFTSRDLHLGEISLECSRAGAAAAALWTTLQALPPTREGLGAHLTGGRQAALDVASALRGSGRVGLAAEPELDIVCSFALRPTATEVTAASEAAFDSLAAAGWHAAKLAVDARWLAERHPGIEPDAETVTTLRCALMKPAHLTVAPALAAALVAHLAPAAPPSATSDPGPRGA
ncbi:MAG: aspartate aminotransferase family protein [Solirubrobacterales bacterium]|nr:aspartate aminotransferase family protein [Solirubrobacterales bacterium]